MLSKNYPAPIDPWFCPVNAGAFLKRRRQPSLFLSSAPPQRLLTTTPVPDPTAFHGSARSSSGSEIARDCTKFPVRLDSTMVNAKNFAFKVNPQTPISQTLAHAYGTVINCRTTVGKRAVKEQKEARSRHVILRNVHRSEGSLKRKRNDEDGDSQEKLEALAMFSAIDAATTTPTRANTPILSQMWQQTKPSRLRKFKPISKGVDLDCWFTILSFSDPAQLLEMRQKIVSCYRFLRHNPMLWKHSRDYYYGSDMPDPPNELTEFQYAHLRHGHGCMSCHAPNTRKTYWAFLRRWCKTCLQSKTVKEHDAMVLLRDANGDDISYLHKSLPSGIFDSWGNFVGVGPATTHSLKTVYLLSDVQKLVADYIDLKARNLDPAIWLEEVRAWHAPKVETALERKSFAHRMEGWEEMARTERTYDYQARKAARKVFFEKQAAQLTPPITVREMEFCPSYRRAIVIPKEPNVTSWLQLKPKLEKEVAALKEQGGIPEIHPPTIMRSGTSTPNIVVEPQQPQQHQQPQQLYRPPMLPMLAFSSGFLGGLPPPHGLPF